MSHHRYTRPPFKVIAHRGNSAQAPENTLEAFREAMLVPVDVLECDVQMTKDRVPVVIHDSTFYRISNNLCKEDVNQLTLSQIKQLDAGSWFDPKYRNEQIPTLEDFLQLHKGAVSVMLDIKPETVNTKELAHVVGDVLKKAPKAGQLLIGSLNPELLIDLHAYMPGEQFIPIVDEAAKLPLFLTIPAKHIALRDSLAKKKMIQELHKKGYEVWAWTVDAKDKAIRLMRRGIDGIITNMPKKMMAIHRGPPHSH